MGQVCALALLRAVETALKPKLLLTTPVHTHLHIFTLHNMRTTAAVAAAQRHARKRDTLLQG